MKNELLKNFIAEAKIAALRLLFVLVAVIKSIILCTSYQFNNYHHIYIIIIYYYIGCGALFFLLMNTTLTFDFINFVF